ncbi:fibrinogen silencer-binding protein isoform X5 [Brienomyrus brachyistius]|uniref:fibrinogen silencer-binding protein isoform X5 n=1 Tax=Brienomyrus brachyistius TaxID=42636 RepID=UPI0020B2A857|nr:fibrinogen silencer-binding protein isoform X5 [Brienomyrus brachyistius]
MTLPRRGPSKHRPSAAMAYRTPNYTHEQKLYFLQRIQGVVDKVQDFRKDVNTTVKRNAAWNELLVAFNAAFPDRPPSSMAMLKTLWKRMKVESRNALIRRQEQIAGGVPVTALTEIQREVSSMVPNLVVKMEATVDADAIVNTHIKAESGTFAVGASDCDQEDITATKIDGSPDRVYTHTTASGSGLPDGSHWTSVSAATTPTADGGRTKTVIESHLDAKVLELSEREHQQKMKVLLVKELMLEDKRKALKQKEKAYRCKKRYYQTKLQKLGAEVHSSSEED